jgi:hypothetical protein
MRRALAADDGPDLRALYRAREGLRHVEHDVAHFVERELGALVAEGKALGGRALEVGAVHLGPSSIAVELHPEHEPAAAPLRLEFRERARWLVAAVTDRPAWVDGLGEAGRTAVANAVSGLLRKGGVDVSREQLDALLDAPPGGLAWDERGVRVEVAGETEASFLLRDVGRGATADAGGVGPLADRVLLRRRPIAWTAWVEAWWNAAEGGVPPRLDVPDVLGGAEDAGAYRGARVTAAAQGG